MYIVVAKCSDNNTDRVIAVEGIFIHKVNSENYQDQLTEENRYQHNGIWYDSYEIKSDMEEMICQR